MGKKKKGFLSRNWIYVLGALVLVYISIVGCSTMAKNKDMKEDSLPRQVAEAPVEKQEKTLEDNKDGEKKIVGMIKPEDRKDEISEPVPGVNYSIVINKGAFELMLMDGDKVVRTFGVAIGKNPGQKQRVGDLTTPTGDFKVDEIDDASYWTHDFGDGKGEIKGAYGPYFISLATPGWSGIGIHGTHDPASIGTRASEGCVRLQNDDLLILKKFVKVGTKVKIEE